MLSVRSGLGQNGLLTRSVSDSHSTDIGPVLPCHALVNHSGHILTMLDPGLRRVYATHQVVPFLLTRARSQNCENFNSLLEDDFFLNNSITIVS